MVNLQKGDCLDLMESIPDHSVDMILCDLPYGTTACKWDFVIPFDKLWSAYKRIIKANGAIVLFGSEPFSTLLRMSNIKMYRYDWIWAKAKGSGFFNARRMPLKNHEILSVFYKKMPLYHPQMAEGKPYICKQGYVGEYMSANKKLKDVTTINNGVRYPTSIQQFKIETGLHPTQKPVALCEYLIKTYTNEGETVLDNCMGSGTTGVACVNTDRNFIGIELDDHYFEVATERINQAQLSKSSQ